MKYNSYRYLRHKFKEFGYEESHGTANNFIVTTNIHLTMKQTKKIYKALKISSNRDIIEDPITFLDIYLKTGEFIISAFFILDLIYSKIIKDDGERIQFILDNCLFTLIDDSDIIQTIYKPRFKRHFKEFFPNYNLNRLFSHLIEISINEKHISIKNLEYKDMKFDVIIGNPPYQGESETKNKGASQTSKNIWPKFFEMSLKKSRMVSSLITPKTLLKKTKFKNIIDNLVYLNIDDCNKYFDVGTAFTYFVIDKVNENNIKTITFYDGSGINTEDVSFLKEIPTTGKFNEKDVRIIKKLISGEKLSFSRGTDKSINENGFYSFKKDNIYKYRCYYSSEKSRKNLYTKEKTKGFGNNLKVAYIFDFTKKNVDHFTCSDINCGAGLQTGVFYLNENEKLNNLKNYLTTSIPKYLNLVLREGRYAYNVFRNIPKIDLTKNWTNDELFDYFKNNYGLIQEEINYIEANV